MLLLALHFFIIMYVLFLGFLMYAALMQAWHRLKIGIKILVVPVLLVFGGFDVLFNLTFGSAIFWERPRQLTFSARLCKHMFEPGWRGKLADAFAVPLNAIFPNHIHPTL